MSWGKRASIIVECLFTAPRFASLSGEHPGRMGATMLGGVKRWLLAMLALALRVAPVPLRAFELRLRVVGFGRCRDEGRPVPRKRGVRLACGASNKGQAESERILRRGRGPFRLGSVGRACPFDHRRTFAPTLPFPTARFAQRATRACCYFPSPGPSGPPSNSDHMRQAGCVQKSRSSTLRI